ncbi:hypothetical protein [Rickettsia endosymbiont of Cardiosporidium cionae]|uniref:hypothetical protein n=1 Tax=Rickettsia endosymbiont of Cardiosporidium cionae TaxID=2777155 RepID=UPI001894029D|nr:hypothetical protein [Rickettsia endosymbiont of Cardiosporidium cionae]KAF8818808.1 hypothetical protein IHI24_000042 [Rickettsia endosymbiont of Cardiosporidium cionae]
MPTPSNISQIKHSLTSVNSLLAQISSTINTVNNLELSDQRSTLNNESNLNQPFTQLDERLKIITHNSTTHKNSKKYLLKKLGDTKSIMHDMIKVRELIANKKIQQFIEKYGNSNNVPIIVIKQASQHVNANYIKQILTQHINNDLNHIKSLNKESLDNIKKYDENCSISNSSNLNKLVQKSINLIIKYSKILLEIAKKSFKILITVGQVLISSYLLYNTFKASIVELQQLLPVLSSTSLLHVIPVISIAAVAGYIGYRVITKYYQKIQHNKIDQYNKQSVLSQNIPITNKEQNKNNKINQTIKTNSHNIVNKYYTDILQFNSKSCNTIKNMFVIDLHSNTSRRFTSNNNNLILQSISKYDPIPKKIKAFKIIQTRKNYIKNTRTKITAKNIKNRTR